MSDTVIKVERLSKYYNLGQINNGTLFQDLQSWIAIKMGREDPNSKLDKKTMEGEGFWALRDINFEVNMGERVGIIGKNGAGKSTLLKILSEITEPTSGKICIRGKVASLLEVGTGFHREMTGRENIYLNGAILGMKRAEINKKINDIIDFSEIGEHIDTPVKRYSSGMYVRLAFAVAANLDSDILIADEVLAVGDLDFQKKAIGKMNDISSREGKTILFVSHNMSAVKGLCNSGILLEKGRVVQRGDIDSVMEAYYNNMTECKDDSIKEKIANLPNDVSFAFVDISVSQNGKQIGGVVGNADPIDIRIKYQVKKREVGLRVNIDILNHFGSLLFRSFHDEQIGETSSIEPGLYECETSIPSNILGPTNYTLRIAATIHNVRGCTGDGIFIPFSVEQNGMYNMAYPNDTFRGELGLVLDWKNMKLD